MALMQNLKSRFVSLSLSIVIFLTGGISLGSAQEQDSALGKLKLHGRYIDQLVLQRKDGRREKLNQPDETIKLPVGEYRLLEAHLEGGYGCRTMRTHTPDWVTVTEDKPALLKVGAPLRQTVKAQRRGRILVLNYELLGIGGEKYTGRDRSKPPTFTVYKGDKEIASDKFEFG